MTLGYCDAACSLISQWHAGGAARRSTRQRLRPSSHPGFRRKQYGQLTHRYVRCVGTPSLPSRESDITTRTSTGTYRSRRSGNLYAHRQELHQKGNQGEKRRQRPPRSIPSPYRRPHARCPHARTVGSQTSRQCMSGGARRGLPQTLSPLYYQSFNPTHTQKQSGTSSCNVR